jgi:hypothetical protein
MDQIGIVGGVISLYASVIMIIVSYFAEIDYFAEVIKALFLEE